MAVSEGFSCSPFLSCNVVAQPDDLAVLHLRRDLLQPTILKAEDNADEGYAEGKVTNTRFGSFPHSTLIGVPWGSQIRASKVDTGSRGRRNTTTPSTGQKRKRAGPNQSETKEHGSTPDTEEAQKISVTAATSGFVHILPPTPENWTASLPHRTQVVYPPDYSYILHRLGARPGVKIIEAGAGSGSFTHAAARAVYGRSRADVNRPQPNADARGGRVWSFEFHEQRATKLKDEIVEHVLEDVVTITHRDVYEDGFAPEDALASSVKANAVFLDLPAPWLAIRHLDRGPKSPLDPSTVNRLCTFSPCMEQVQKTVTTLRQSGWVEIEVVELSAKRVEARRERIGLQEQGLRGVHDSAATVEEALARLVEVESRTRAAQPHAKTAQAVALPGKEEPKNLSKQERLKQIKEAESTRKLYKEGQLVTRAEAELKSHTSYLTFALLPCAWTDEDEKMAGQRWPAATKAIEGPANEQDKK